MRLAYGRRRYGDGLQGEHCLQAFRTKHEENEDEQSKDRRSASARRSSSEDPARIWSDFHGFMAISIASEQHASQAVLGHLLIFRRRTGRLDGRIVRRALGRAEVLKQRQPVDAAEIGELDYRHAGIEVDACREEKNRSLICEKMGRMRWRVSV